VTSIGSAAFGGCCKLSSAFFPGSGTAPTTPDMKQGGAFPPETTLYYNSTATGWTSPTWHGYTAVAQTEHTISYDANGGNNAPKSQTGDNVSGTIISDSEPTRTGFAFIGWATTSTLIGAPLTPNDMTTVDSDTTLYAVWQQKRDNAYPELWITGGELNSDGSAEVNVILAGCGKETSGSFTLSYDPELCTLTSASAGSAAGDAAVIKSPLGSGANLTAAGTVTMEWSGNTASNSSQQMLVLKFSKAAAGSGITLSGAATADSTNTVIAGLKLYSGTFKSPGTILQALQQEKRTVNTNSGTQIDMTIDLVAADKNLAGSTSSLNLMLALYNKDGKLITTKYSPATAVTFDNNGLALFTLSADCPVSADTVKVFAFNADSTMKPCTEDFISTLN
jgi:uncharacterized repeat protein (TIGR02543 family)